MECCICKGEIAVHGTGTAGHNAEPVVDNGQCCDNCNATVVIPTRIRTMGVDEKIGKSIGKFDRQRVEELRNWLYKG